MSITKHPLFSIVIANYNYGQFLEQAIQSILRQTIENYEIIVVDGGSNDKSVAILNKHNDKISWWVSEQDKGQSSAFNKGFAQAKGDYFFWLNADDLLLPQSLFYATRVIEKDPNVAWIAANTIYFSLNGEIEKCSRGPDWKDFLVRDAPIYIFGPTSIFHRRLFIDANGFDEDLHYSMDTDLWQRFKARGYRFTRIHHYFWGFRRHKNSKTSHAFTSRPTRAFSEEQKHVNRKNNVRYTNRGRTLQLLYKVCCGTLIHSYIDTVRLRGKNILEL